MTLRARLAIFLALAVAIAVAAVASAAYVSASRETRGEVEEFLVQRAGLLATVSDLSSRFPDPRMMAGRRLGGVAELFATDSIVQAIDKQGNLVFAFEGEPKLPVDDVGGVLAAGPGHYTVGDVWVDDIHYMAITVPLAQDLALQIARDLSETDAILNGLRLRLFGIGGLGVILAALMGWLAVSYTHLTLPTTPYV